MPQLPECHTPSRKVYGDFLLNSDWDFTDNVVVGHSSGAVEVLNMLDDERFPKFHLAVMVGAWAGGKPNGYDTNEQFEDLFPSKGFIFSSMKAKASQLAFLHGDDDPYCPLEQAEYLSRQLGAPITVIPGGHHLGKRIVEFPQLLEVIEHNPQAK